MRRWTTEEREFCQDRATMKRSELTRQLNERFGTNRNIDQVRSYCQRNGFMTGRQFRGGYTAKVGTRSRRHAKRGYPGVWHIKVAEPNVWVKEHRLLWESVHGPIPDGHVLIFIDGDQDNIAIDNLALLARRELAVLNRKYSDLADPTREERQALILMARIHRKRLDLVARNEEAV